MSDKTPKFSVVIPAFNAGEYLAATLRSVAKQDYPHVEVILMDGGSTDATGNIVGEFPDLVTVYVSEHDQGQLDALQKGLFHASGDIIHWLNADDIMMPGTLRYVADIFSSRPDVDVVFSDNFAFHETQQRLFVGPTIRGMSYSDHVLFYRQMYSECVFWRREITRHLRPEYYDLRVYTDYAFIANLRRGRSSLWVPKRLGAFRIRENQASQAHKERKVREYRRIRSAIYDEHAWTPGAVLVRKVAHAPSFFLRQWVWPRVERVLRAAVRRVTRDAKRRRQADAFFGFWLTEERATTERVLFR